MCCHFYHSKSSMIPVLSSTLGGGGIDYRACVLSATRAKIAYLSYDDVKTLWSETVADEKSVIHYVFRDVVDEPLYFSDPVSSVVVYAWIQDRTLHVVFRGTKGAADVKIDIDEVRASLFPGNKDVLVHSGFLEQFRAAQPFILEVFEKNKDLIETVHFSGHSLGGALATLAACYFSPIIRAVAGCKIKCHTFGSPRIGNKAFVAWFDGKVDESYRILNFKDPVPLLPLNGFYSHIFGGLEISDKNTVKNIGHDVPWIMRLLYLPFEIYYRNPIGNHACDLYIKRLLALADWPVTPF